MGSMDSDTAQGGFDYAWTNLYLAETMARPCDRDQERSAMGQDHERDRIGPNPTMTVGPQR